MHKLLRDNPETLRTDFTQTGANLSQIFCYTQTTLRYGTGLSVPTTHQKKRGRCSARQIVIERKDSNSTFLTVNIYHNGTTMFQGSEASLSSVQDDFNTIKTLKDRRGEGGGQDSNTQGGRGGRGRIETGSSVDLSLGKKQEEEKGEGQEE